MQETIATAPDQPGAPLPGLAALDFTALLPERSAEEILAGHIYAELAGKRYTLRVLSIAANRRWADGFGGRLQWLMSALETAGDDLAGVMSAFATVTDLMLGALYAYDQAYDEQGLPTRPGVLPPRDELEETATDAEVLRATLGVWSAANPFAGVALSALRAAEGRIAPPSASSQPMNTAPPSTAGRRRTSSKS